MTKAVTEKVRSFLQRHSLESTSLIVAVSGGADSVCLLHVLSGLKEELSLKLHVAHLDHELRDDSAADADFVAQLAGELRLSITVERADVRKYRREKGLGLEEAAREIRYRYLGRLARELGVSHVITGHTQNDQVETMLLHILRGTGLQGLTGLKPLTPWSQDGNEFVIARPLLEVRRTETEGYCCLVNLQPRLDITNLSRAPLRNRIRHELLPRLREYNHGIEDALLRLAASAEIDMKFLETETAKAWKNVGRMEGNAAVLDKAALYRLPIALQRHLIRYALGHLPGGLKDIEMRHIDEIMSKLGLAVGQRIALPRGRVFAADYDCYWLGCADELSPLSSLVISGEHQLIVPGITQLPGWQAEARLAQGRPAQERNELTAYFDFETTGQDLTVRTWRCGDRFVPLGLMQEKKLGEFMIAEKIPRRLRGDIPLVTSPQQIIWLVGHRIDDRAKVTTETTRVLKLEFRKIGS